MTSLPAIDRAAYARDGFVRLGRFLDEAGVVRLLDALAMHLGTPKATGQYGILRHNLWRSLEPLQELVGDGRLARLACEVLEEDEVVLFQDHLIWKPPGTTEPIEWHQDFSYWPLARPAGVTLWLALDDADVANGCMSFVAGTHREGERRPTSFVAGRGDMPERSDLAPIDARGRAETPLVARRGELSAHHPLAWHGSGPNTSGRERRAWSLTWISTRNSWDKGHAPHPFVWELRPANGTPPRGALFPVFRGGERVE
jgi:ectoine hydroxylase-related dioxygenase (phytanoyl-CoA dioxygenase family)